MIRTSHSIATKFDTIVKALETFVLSKIQQNQEKHNAVLVKISDALTQHTDVINNQGK